MGELVFAEEVEILVDVIEVQHFGLTFGSDSGSGPINKRKRFVDRVLIGC
jgi:hypothetical protein